MSPPPWAFLNALHGTPKSSSCSELTDRVLPTSERFSDLKNRVGVLPPRTPSSSSSSSSSPGPSRPLFPAHSGRRRPRPQEPGPEEENHDTDTDDDDGEPPHIKHELKSETESETENIFSTPSQKNLLLPHPFDFGDGGPKKHASNNLHEPRSFQSGAMVPYRFDFSRMSGEDNVFGGSMKSLKFGSGWGGEGRAKKRIRAGTPVPMGRSGMRRDEKGVKETSILMESDEEEEEEEECLF